MTRLELGRLFLIAGQPVRAALVFESLFENGGHEQTPRDCLAFYLGLCAERKQDFRSAESWYERAESFAVADPKAASHARYLRLARTALCRSTEPVLVASNAPHFAPGAQEVTALSKEDLAATYEELAESRAEYDKDKNNLTNKIRYMSSLLLNGEIVADDQNEFRRHATASLRFEEGQTLLAEVTAALLEDDSKKAAGGSTPFEIMIRDQPEIAMRLDLVKVRLLKLQNQQHESAVVVNVRLKSLQAIVKANSEATHGMMMSHLSMLLNDYESAKQQSQVAALKIREIKDEYEERSKKDPYVLSPEPVSAQRTEAEAKMMLLAPHTKLAESQLNAISGLAALELVRQAGVGAQRGPLIAWANGAAEKSQTVDDSNPIAHYVLGLAKEEAAVEETRLNPADSQKREASVELFAKARKSFKEAERLIEQRRGNKPAGLQPGGGEPIALALLGTRPILPIKRVLFQPGPQPDEAQTPASVAEKIKDHLRGLSGSSEYLNKALEATSRGRPGEAFDELRRGLEHAAAAGEQFLGPLWLAYAETGLRAGIDREKLRREIDDADRAKDGKIFTKGDYASVFIKAKISIVEVLETMAKAPKGRLDDATAAQLRKSLKTETDRLAKALSLCDNEEGDAKKELARARCNAYWALTIALQATLNDDPNYKPGPEESKAQTIAWLAQNTLEGGIAANGPDRFDLSDARIAGLVAYGHLTALTQKDYRIQAGAAFSQVFEMLSNSPLRPTIIKAVGSPLLTTIMSRPENQPVIEARTDQRLRQAMEYFVDGAISLHLENPSAASHQMSQGIDLIKTDKDPAPRKRMLDASDLIAKPGDGTVLQVRNSLEAYLVLSLLEAGETDAALLAALRTIDPQGIPEAPAGPIGRETIERAARNIPSPLEGYALARALEAKAVSFGFRSDKRAERIDLLRQARIAIGQTNEFLRYPVLKERFPGLVRLSEQVDNRLKSADYFVELASKYRVQSRLIDADRTLDEGLKRHPSSSRLWKAKVELALDRAEASGGENVQAYRDALTLLHTWDTQAAATGYERHYWEGQVQEGLGEWAKALDAYNKALRLGKDDDDLRVRILSRIALVRAHGSVPAE